MTPEEAFAESMEDLAAGSLPPRIGVAVSGGSDSMALLRLACDWAGPRDVVIAAATVDHGLRAEAAAEAAMVAEACRALGVRHDVLEWRWDGQGNLQEAARLGRRSALAAWAGQTGVDTILLGHTVDDQAETVLMRLVRGSGVDGLCGMDAAIVAGGRHWWRPLLQLRRQALRDWLSASGHAWVDDPSNEDPRFDRVRMRAMLEELGLTVERVTRTAEHMRSARATLERVARAFVLEHVREDGGDLIFDPTGLRQEEGDTLWRVLAEGVQWIGGEDHRPRFDALRFFFGQVCAGKAATLAGCLAMPDASGGMRLVREFGAAEQKVPFRPGIMWDKRWIVEGPEDPELCVGALGLDDLQLFDWRSTGRPRQALAAGPALRRGAEVVAAPLIEGGPWTARIVAPFKDRFDSR